MATGELLQLSPSTELAFKFELKRNIPATLTLRNPTGARVAFKVKTTSPKKYCVRPSSGVVEPGATKDVQVRVGGRGVRCVRVGGLGACTLMAGSNAHTAPRGVLRGAWARQGGRGVVPPRRAIQRARDGAGAFSCSAGPACCPPPRATVPLSGCTMLAVERATVGRPRLALRGGREGSGK